MHDKLQESEAMREVWEWKDAAYAEVAHLPLAEALRTRRRLANETAKQLGLANRIRDPRPWRQATPVPKHGS